MATTTINVNTTVPVGNTLYVDAALGNDDPAAPDRFDLPYLTPEAAKTAASAGDLIKVRPGNYAITTNLAKDGVNWHLEEGAVFTLATDQTVDMFGDSDGAKSYSIGGYGTLITDPTDVTNICHAISVTDPASIVYVNCLDIINAGTASVSVFSDPIHHDGGQLVVQCRDILVQGNAAGYPVWWSDGRMSIHARNIRQLSEGSGGVAVSATSVNMPTGECFVKCDLIESANPGSYALHQEVTVDAPTSDSTAKVWIEALSILGNRHFSGTATNHAINKGAGGNLYVTTQKVSGSLRTVGAYGTFYLNAQKQQGWMPDDPADGMIDLAGHLSHINILEAIDGGNTGAHIYVSAGTHNVNIGSFVKDSAGDCVLMEGGTLNLTGVFDTSVSATSSPINLTGGSLTLNGCILTAEATQPSVKGSSVSFIANGSTVYQALQATVTVDGDLFYDDGVSATGNVATQNADGTWSWAAASGGGAVDSVNGQTGTVVLGASDVGADPAGSAASAQAAAIQRANHTGTQLASTVSDFNSAALAAAPAETTTTVGALLNGATAKTTPVDADVMGLSDSAASNVWKKVTWANIKATLAAYFDTIYLLKANNLSGLANVATAQVNLGMIVNNGSPSYATSSTSFSDVTGSSFTLAANKTWRIEIIVAATSANLNSGPNVSVSCTNSPTIALFREMNQSEVSLNQRSTIVSNDGGISFTAVGSTTDLLRCSITGTITTGGSASVVTLRLSRQGSSASNVTVVSYGIQCTA